MLHLLSPWTLQHQHFLLNDPFSHSIGPVLVPLILPSSRAGNCLIWGSHKITTKDRAKRRLWTQKRSWKVQTFAKLQANHSVIGWSFWCDKIYNCVHTKPPYNVYFYAPCRASLIWWCGTQKNTAAWNAMVDAFFKGTGASFKVGAIQCHVQIQDWKSQNHLAEPSQCSTKIL